MSVKFRLFLQFLNGHLLLIYLYAGLFSPKSQVTSIITINFTNLHPKVSNVLGLVKHSLLE